jgi:hypothetical protein
MGCLRVQRIPWRNHRAERLASGSYIERMIHQVSHKMTNSMISITVNRPVYSEATSKEAPNSMPGIRKDGAQMTQAGISTAKKRGGFIPIIPATAGIIGRRGPMKRPATTLLAPWSLKNLVPRSIIPGKRENGQISSRCSWYLWPRA